jgi:hypothetical protein
MVDMSGRRQDVVRGHQVDEFRRGRMARQPRIRTGKIGIVRAP